MLKELEKEEESGSARVAARKSSRVAGESLERRST